LPDSNWIIDYLDQTHHKIAGIAAFWQHHLHGRAANSQETWGLRRLSRAEHFQVTSAALASEPHGRPYSVVVKLSQRRVAVAIAMSRLGQAPLEMK
jgi:hypothetical protein